MKSEKGKKAVSAKDLVKKAKRDEAKVMKKADKKKCK